MLQIPTLRYLLCNSIGLFSFFKVMRLLLRQEKSKESYLSSPIVASYIMYVILLRMNSECPPNTIMTGLWKTHVPFLVFD